MTLVETEFGLPPFRKTPYTRYKPARACLEACLTETARETEVSIQWCHPSYEHHYNGP